VDIYSEGLMRRSGLQVKVTSGVNSSLISSGKHNPSEQTSPNQRSKVAQHP
jgi:hypothetical protein